MAQQMKCEFPQTVMGREKVHFICKTKTLAEFDCFH